MQPRHNEIVAFLRAALGVLGTGPHLTRLWQYCEWEHHPRAVAFLVRLYAVGREPHAPPADGQPGREAVLALVQAVGYDTHLTTLERAWRDRICAGPSTAADMIFALDTTLKLGNNFLLALRRGALTEEAFRHIVSPELVAHLPWEVVIPWFFGAVRCANCGDHVLLRPQCQCGTPLPQEACALCGYVAAPFERQFRPRCVACNQEFSGRAVAPWYERTDAATTQLLAEIITTSFGFHPAFEDEFWRMVGWSDLIVGLPSGRLRGVLEALYATGAPFTNAVVRSALPVIEVVARVPREVIMEQYFDLVLGWLGRAEFSSPQASSPPADAIEELADADIELDET